MELQESVVTRGLGDCVEQRISQRSRPRERSRGERVEMASGEWQRFVTDWLRPHTSIVSRSSSLDLIVWLSEI